MSQPNQPAGSNPYGQPSYAQYSAQQPAAYPAQPTGLSPTGYPPPSHAGWAVATILFFWPLAFAAFNHLHNIYPRWAMGDFQGAQEASDRVKSLGKIALWIFVGFFIAFVVLYGVIIAAAISAVGNAGYR
ncbi:MAG TPA: CD225/dispanin family protein [Pseudonocardia sp.]|jgi:hypothetical protein|nr:CD225/dispanin family protein [Pseudonocardia sp.]